MILTLKAHRKMTLPGAYGLRVEYADGFGLARSSNTTPVVVMRFEAESKEALQRIQNEFRRVILFAKADAVLPFDAAVQGNCLKPQ
jgi:phosphomannomutase